MFKEIKEPITDQSSQSKQGDGVGTDRKLNPKFEELSRNQAKVETRYANATSPDDRTRFEKRLRERPFSNEEQNKLRKDHESSLEECSRLYREMISSGRQAKHDSSSRFAPRMFVDASIKKAKEDVRNLNEALDRHDALLPDQPQLAISEVEQIKRLQETKISRHADKHSTGDQLMGAVGKGISEHEKLSVPDLKKQADIVSNWFNPYGQGRVSTWFNYDNAKSPTIRQEAKRLARNIRYRLWYYKAAELIQTNPTYAIQGAKKAIIKYLQYVRENIVTPYLEREDEGRKEDAERNRKITERGKEIAEKRARKEKREKAEVLRQVKEEVGEKLSEEDINMRTDWVYAVRKGIVGVQDNDGVDKQIKETYIKLLEIRNMEDQLEAEQLDTYGEWKQQEMKKYENSSFPHAYSFEESKYKSFLLRRKQMLEELLRGEVPHSSSQEN